MSSDSVLPRPDQPAFFSGQRLTPADLTAAQDYHREMRWLHARSLHAWGIALGLIASGDRGAREVRVEPGYALDNLGRDLVLTEPMTVPVPPVAGDESGNPVLFYLTISYIEDSDARTIEKRNGVCAGEGAVRLADQPLVRWQPVYESRSGIGSGGDGSKGEYRVGLDVVLAAAQVHNCRLDTPLSLAERRDARPSTQPYVAGGATPERLTVWTTWYEGDEDNGLVLGVFTVVDTSSGRFKSTPTYLAQLVGERQYPFLDLYFYEGWVQVHDPKPDQFTFRLFMPEHRLSSGWHLNPPSTLTDPTVLATLSDPMRWHVVWTGLEG